MRDHRPQLVQAFPLGKAFVSVQYRHPDLTEDWILRLPSHFHLDMRASMFCTHIFSQAVYKILTRKLTFIVELLIICKIASCFILC